MTTFHTKPSALDRFREFMAIYRAYRTYHSIAYSFRIAYGIIYGNLPF